MTRPIKFTDISYFQPFSLAYMKQLRNDGSQFNFVKLTEDPSLTWPHKWFNAKAPAQIRNSMNIWGSVGVYHFLHTVYGNSASFFISKAKEMGLDFATTKIAVDVEASDLPYYCTDAINEFETQLVNAGFKPGNIWTYTMISWLNAGRVVPSKLKYGFVWAAMYPYSNVYSDNKLSAHSSLNPRYNAWQFSGLGSQDWSYDYTGSLLSNPKPKTKKKRAKHKIIKKPSKAKKTTNHYLTKGKQFKVLSSSLNGYKDPEFDYRNGNVLTKNSLINGRVLRFNGYTRLDTPIGWFSTNTKYLKAVK